MLVIRSHLEQTGTLGLGYVGADTLAIKPATVSMRSLALTVPSCCWNSTVSRRGGRGGQGLLGRS